MDWTNAFSSIGNGLYNGGKNVLDFMGTDAGKNLTGLGGLGVGLYSAINQKKSQDEANKLMKQAFDYNLQKDKDMQNNANTAYMNSSYARGM